MQDMNDISNFAAFVLTIIIITGAGAEFKFPQRLKFGDRNVRNLG